MDAFPAAPLRLAPLPIEETVIWLVHWPKLGVEIIGAGLVAVGLPLVWSSSRAISSGAAGVTLRGVFGPGPLSRARVPARRRQPRDRAELGTNRKLGAIAVIRTGLNFFLAMEMEQEALRAI